MIYLDTSAFIKLYIREADSDLVNRAVTGQDDPLPFWLLHRVEMRNALRLKVFRGELENAQVDGLVRLIEDRLQSGFYFTPELGIGDLTEFAIRFTEHTPDLGCRSLDILHVAVAKLIGAARFMTFDDRQEALARKVGLVLQ